MNETPALRLEWRSPQELVENPANWRRHPDAQLAALGDVLADVGWCGACLLNEATGHLIDGHARRQKAIERGDAKVPVLVGSWTEEQESRILATLDPLAAMAETDAGRLDALLQDVQTESASVQQLLEDLHTANPALPDEVDLPDLKPTERHTVVVPYDDRDKPTLAAFLGVDTLPENGMGRKLIVKIREVVASSAGHPE